MVDALREVHRVLTPGGTLVDARPDSRVLTYVERRSERGFQRFGTVGTNAAELATDGAADRAITQAKREGLFTRKRQGRFWHRVPFDGLAELRQYLAEHMRFVHRARWSVDVSERRRHARDRFVIRRGVRYEVLERSGSSAS